MAVFSAQIFDVITLEYDEDGALCSDCQEAAHKLNQTLWPDHCVMDTQGAEISERIMMKTSDIIVKKGFNCDVSKVS